MERFLYRLGKSPHAERFILKGALLLIAWRAPVSRPTMDIDFAARTDNRPDHIKAIVSAVCAVAVDPDGIEFSRESIEVSRIKEDANYEGARVQFHATLARARIPMQLNIGFVDAITPGPTEVVYPTMLDFPAPVPRAYPKESVIAEKLEAITVLGLLNTRMNDYYDLALLSRMYPFDGEPLAQALLATFRQRGTIIEAEPIGLTRAYWDDPARILQWRAFVRRSQFGEMEGDLVRLVGEIRPFLLPVLSKIVADRPFNAQWKPGGPWE